jgi:hypothetical protein
MDRLRKPFAGTTLVSYRARARSVLVGSGIAGQIILGSALVGCSDSQRIPDGERFSDTVTGVPGVFLIDDMEDGSQYLLSDSGFTGLWYIYNDASLNAVQEPSLGFPMYPIAAEDGSALSDVWPPRPCGFTPQTPFFEGEAFEECQFVARTWGTGQRGWGAGVGLDLNGEGGTKNPVDASRFGGIGFYAIGDIRGDSLRVNVQDVRTTPESAEAADRRQIPRCTNTSTSRCNDHFGTAVRVTNTWTWIEIPFSCMVPGGWGFPGTGAPFLSSAVVGIQFQITGADPADTGMPTMTPVETFDFAIDNLAFLDASRVANPAVCPVAP